MQKASPNSDDLLWPVFGLQQLSKINSFWDKQRKSSTNQQKEWQLMDSFSRLGKLKKKVKTYHFMLDEKYVLYYFKSEKDKVPKGSIQLSEDIQIRLEHFQVGNNEDAIAITFFNRTDKIRYKIFNLLSEIVFKWYEILRCICSINNFDSIYMAIELIGKGTFATVYKVKRLLDDELFVGKFYYVENFQTNPQKEKFVRMIKNEVLALRSLDHPGIVKLHEIYQQNDKLVLITNLVQGLDLYQLIRANKKLTESHSVVIINNLARALQHITSKGFVHRDVKLENVIVTSKNFLETVLLDFGFAEKINNDKQMSKAGTPGYIAPEVFESKPYTEKGDVFSLGVIFYSLVSGRSPFTGTTFSGIMEANREAKVCFDKSAWNDISDDCKLLITRMMSPIPDARNTFTEILENPYVKAKMDLFRSKIQSNYIKCPSIQKIQSEKYSDSFDIKSKEFLMKSFFKKRNSSNIQSINQVQAQQTDLEEEEEEKDLSYFVPSENVTTNVVSIQRLKNQFNQK